MAGDGLLLFASGASGRQDLPTGDFLALVLHGKRPALVFQLGESVVLCAFDIIYVYIFKYRAVILFLVNLMNRNALKKFQANRKFIIQI